MKILKSQNTRIVGVIFLTVLVESISFAKQVDNFPRKVMTACEQQVEITLGEPVVLSDAIKFPSTDSFSSLTKTTNISRWLLRNGGIGTMPVKSLDEERMSCIKIRQARYLVNPKTGKSEDEVPCYSLVEKNVLLEREQFLNNGLAELSKQFVNFSFVQDEIILSPYGSFLVAFDNVELQLAVFDFKKAVLIRKMGITKGALIDQVEFEPKQKLLKIHGLNLRNSWFSEYLPLDSDNLNLADEYGVYHGSIDSVLNGRYLVDYGLSETKSDSSYIYVSDLKNGNVQCSVTLARVPPIAYVTATFISPRANSNEIDLYYVIKGESNIYNESNKLMRIHVEIK